jgi:UDP-N-acetylmuramoyl-L-alanyl-D-glutamate--2,6-diaminopimelate ligase
MKKIIPQSIRNFYHLLQAIFSNVCFGFPSKKIKVIGVTGTNGKTTTVQMISKVLEKAGNKVAVISTINFKVGGDTWVNKTKFTTFSSWKIQKFIKRAVKWECEYLILETSSHALDQKRVWGIQYEIAAITNITREHLDYHRTMEKYEKAKMKLFKKSNVSIVNLGMKNAEKFLELGAEKKYLYGVNSPHRRTGNQDKKQKTILAENVKLNLDGSRFSVDGEDFNLNLMGEFNIENALVAICVGMSQKIDLNLTSQALSEIKKIPGRMDYVKNDLGLRIIIDYALTPDSMEKLGKLITSIKNQGNSENKPKVIWVFGSCGERDRGKRPMMGKIVSQHADFLIVTNEDPYHESPQGIIDEVFGGVKNKTENEDAWRIMSRRRAIKKALELAQKGDIILVTGKGAEETMAMGKRRIPWNDKKVVEEILKDVAKY